MLFKFYRTVMTKRVFFKTFIKPWYVPSLYGVIPVDQLVADNRQTGLHAKSLRRNMNERTFERQMMPVFIQNWFIGKTHCSKMLRKPIGLTGDKSIFCNNRINRRKLQMLTESVCRDEL